MNGVNMPMMNSLGGPVAGMPMPTMNNAQMGQPGGSRQAQLSDNNRIHFNTYIYEYFLRNGLHECARAMLQSDCPVKTKEGSNGRRDENGNPLGNGIGDDPMDTDSKSDIDSKRPDDLPAPDVPMGLTDSCFLYEWFCLFWDMCTAQKGKGAAGQVNAYLNHAQNASRMRQSQQQDMMRGMPQAQYNAHMMRNMQNSGLNMNLKPQGNHLQRTAMANSQANPGNAQMAQKQGQPPREGSDMDANRGRGSSPSSAENAPSPSKRARIGEASMNPAQNGMMPNGRPNGPPGQQLQNLQGPNSNPAAQQKQTYAANLSQHQIAQMGGGGKPMPGQQPSQGSPMLQQGPDSAAMAAFYNATENMNGPNGMRPQMPGGQQGGGAGTSHALQDYQVQLMLLEQQNKKRLMMARQESEPGQGPAMGGAGGPGGNGGPGAPGMPAGANGVFQGASPQGARPGASPNPTEQMKRAGQLAQGGSPLPDGSQSRGSPGAMNFIPGQMDPSTAPHFFKDMNGGGMAMNGQPNGMRGPNGQPIGGPQGFPGQMNPQQQQFVAAQQARMQAMQNGQGMPAQQWQQQQAALQAQQQQAGGPGAMNGNPMAGGMPGQPQPGGPQGTPQQQPRAMPPPSQPGVANAANNARNTASPQIANAAPPTSQQSKAGTKKKEPKAGKVRNPTTKKSNSNLNNAVATPVAESNDGDAAPATPMTPANATFKPGQNPPMPVPPAQVPQASAMVPPPNTDANANAYSLDNAGGMDSFLDFANPNMSSDVIADFDFETFLNDNNEGGDQFDFPSTFGLEGASEVGAE